MYPRSFALDFRNRDRAESESSRPRRHSAVTFSAVTVSSTIVFHWPHPGHFPTHFGDSCPHSLRRKLSLSLPFQVGYNVLWIWERRNSARTTAAAAPTLSDSAWLAGLKAESESDGLSTHGFQETDLGLHCRRPPFRRHSYWFCICRSRRGRVP